MAAPYKLHGGNRTTRSLHAWNECTKREYAKDVLLPRHPSRVCACCERHALMAHAGERLAILLRYL